MRCGEGERDDDDAKAQRYAPADGVKVAGAEKGGQGHPDQARRQRGHPLSKILQRDHQAAPPRAGRLGEVGGARPHLAAEGEAL